jgi:NitT/TauT family transport system substrate-binding protein
MLVLAALLLSLIAGCSRNEPAPPVKPRPFKICQGGILATLPLIAKEKGFFLEEGIAAEIELVGDGKAAMGKFLNGQCDASLTGEFPLVRQSFDRDDIVIIATLASSDNVVKVLARRDRGINSLGDLAGKRIGVSKGTISNFFLDQFLKKNHIPAENLTIIDISHAKIADALKRGDIDAFAGSDVAYLKGRQAIDDQQKIVFTEPGLTNHAACLVVRKEWLAANPGVAHSVLKALLRAEKELSQNSEELTKMLSQKLNIRHDDLKSIIAEQHNRVSLDQVLLLALEDEARWMRENGVVKAKAVPNYLRFLDPSVLKGISPSAVKLK